MIKKILVLAKHLDGGTGTFLTQFTRLVAVFPNKYQIKILALHAPQFRLKKGFTVPLVFYKTQQDKHYYYRLTPSTLGKIILEWAWFHREVADYTPDVVMTIDAHCAFLGCVEKTLRPRLKVVLTIHNNLRAVTFHKLTSLGRRLMIWVSGRLFRASDEIVGVSKGVSADIQMLFSLNKSVQTIYNGSDGPKRKPLRTISQSPLLISVGRLAPQKDFYTTIRAVTLLKLKFPNIRLQILGDGDDRKTLEDVVSGLKVRKNVEFVGWKDQTMGYLKRANIYILSSHFEGFSYSLLEAMQLGLPVIATDTPYGPSEILDGGRYGLLIKQGDPQALADAIVKLASDRQLYKTFSRLSYERSGFFSTKTMVVQYDTLFQSMGV